MRLKLLVLLMLLIVPSAMTAAQASCPANILLLLSRAAAVCSRAERNQACYGSGAVGADFYADPVTFAQPGDMADSGAIQTLQTGGEAGEWGVAALQTQANLADTQQRSVSLLLFGQAQVVNEVPPVPQLMLVSTGTVNIRAEPRLNAEIIERVGVRGTVNANGRSADGSWLRVRLPDSRIGWVAREAPITSSGSPQTLHIVEVGDPAYRPFQSFTVRTARDDAPCEGAPASGLLVQTPNTVDWVDLVINGLPVRMAATVFIQADDVLTLNVLDGQVEAGAEGTRQYVPAGARLQVPLDADLSASGASSPAEPYDEADLVALPLNNLPVRLRVMPALTQAEIDERVTAYNTPRPTPIPPQERARNVCVRQTIRDENLYAGPGLFYEVINEIRRGTRLMPVLQANDADGMVWWQLRNSNWIQARAVASSGPCPDVPLADVISPPRNNTLSLETCETTNGQLRAGQQVTITFLPPAWETLADAQAAPRIDPGSITINGVALPVRASSPERIAPERYVRVFSTTWRAEAGAHRIEGERLHYIAICNLTVPVG